MQIQIGADPELFLKRKGFFINAHDMIPGTKAAPHPVNGGAVQVDGMALEFNINPAGKPEQFVDNINTVLGELRNMIPEDFDFSFAAVATFDPEYMLQQPPESLLLGCEPDFDAYQGKENAKPDNAQPMRTAAGHVHIGWREGEQDSQHIEECRAITRQLDYVLGIPSMVLDHDFKRREMYGKAGAFRAKPYGAEYRVLSNFWLKSPALMEWVFTNTKQGVDMLVDHGVDLFDKFGETARDIINNNKVEDAAYLLENDLSPYVNIRGV